MYAEIDKVFNVPFFNVTLFLLFTSRTKHVLPYLALAKVLRLRHPHALVTFSADTV